MSKCPESTRPMANPSKMEPRPRTKSTIPLNRDSSTQEHIRKLQACGPQPLSTVNTTFFTTPYLIQHHLSQRYSTNPAPNPIIQHESWAPLQCVMASRLKTSQRFLPERSSLFQFQHSTFPCTDTPSLLTMTFHRSDNVLSFVSSQSPQARC